MRYLRRLVWYIASRLFIALILLGILTVTFYYAMNATNIYVIVKDGMARRAQVVMMDEPLSSLDAYFTSTWIERDQLIQSAVSGTDPYQNVSVTGFDHRISLHSVWCWPWDDVARATFVESIEGIDGRLQASKRGMASEMGLGNTPPAWNRIRYKAVLTRENEQWIIRSLQQEAVLTGK